MSEHDIGWDCEEAKGCDWVIYNVKTGTCLFVLYGVYRNSHTLTFYCTKSRCALLKVSEVEFEDWMTIKRPAKKDEPENIYTQEMFEAGELPKVGMMVMVNDEYGSLLHDIKNNDLVECICHSIDVDGNNIGVYRHNSGVSVSINLDYIKPIDTRTDKQKLADQIDNFIIDKNINAIDTEKFIDAIINGEFENIKYTGEK